MEVRFFNRSIERFIGSLNPVAYAKVLRTIEMLERFGNRLGLPFSKSIGHGLFELRIHGEQSVRLIYMYQNDIAIAVIVHGFLKKTQQIAKKDYDLALSRKNKLDGI